MKTRDKSKGPESYTKVIIIQVMHGMAREQNIFGRKFWNRSQLMSKVNVVNEI